MTLSSSGKHKCLLLTHEQVNFSPTKMNFSFSKDKRFKSLAGHTLEASEFTHTLPSTFGRRSPSFGVGERFRSIKQGKLALRPNRQSIFSFLYLLCLSIEGPPMGHYRHLSDFDTENRNALPKTAYYTFGNSATREQMGRTYNPMGGNSPRLKDA